MKYSFDPLAFLGFVASGGFAAAFALGGQRWLVLGAVLAAIAGGLKASIKLSTAAANAPAKALVVNDASDSVPVVNGDGRAIGQVQMQTNGAATTPTATATKL